VPPKSPPARAPEPQEKFAALDLGTNNCRLLIASPRGRGFRIFDAFSRIVRLGEGVSATGALSEDAMARTLDALKVCADKVARRGVVRTRCIATQACRSAANGPAFLARVERETGLKFEIITPAEEARLAVTGCGELMDHEAPAGLIFDIGGGSTEISWVRPRPGDGRARTPEIIAWTSLPLGVVNLSERHGGREMTREAYAALIEALRAEIAAVGDPAGMRALFAEGQGHFLGTSGTVTSIAGVHLGLPRYRRDKVDGLWLSNDEVRGVSERLRAMSYEERSNEPCIGVERADLVVCGCAILEALLLEWPATRIRVADRGLREGILVGLAQEKNRERGRNRRRRRRPGRNFTPPSALPEEAR
jgi:exopolyphosphatase/guanosine-5'-triphosphate,3'-diphosphate pyrophosphatase